MKRGQPASSVAGCILGGPLIGHKLDTGWQGRLVDVNTAKSHLSKILSDAVTRSHREGHIGIHRYSKLQVIPYSIKKLHVNYFQIFHTHVAKRQAVSPLN